MGSEIVWPLHCLAREELQGNCPEADDDPDTKYGWDNEVDQARKEEGKERPDTQHPPSFDPMGELEGYIQR